jgi:hypothetical protein
MARLFALLLLIPVPGRATHRRTDHGDVPGWVLVTVMSVGLVSGIALVAGPELEQMLRSALNRVK